MRKPTFLTTWVAPFALVSAVLLWRWHRELAVPTPAYWSLSFVSLLAYASLFPGIRSVSRKRPSEVLDDGKALHIRFPHRVEIVPYSNIAKIDVTKLINLTQITLRLRQIGESGPTISFYPLQERNGDGANAVAVSLREKVERAAQR